MTKTEMKAAVRKKLEDKDSDIVHDSESSTYTNFALLLFSCI